MNKITTNLETPKINHRILEDILGGIPTAKMAVMNMMQVVTHVFEATAMHYSLKFWEERNLREKYEQKVVDKVYAIALRDQLIKSLTLSEEDTKKVQDYYDGL